MNTLQPTANKQTPETVDVVYVELLAPHTHGRVQYDPKTVLSMTSSEADWMVANGRGKLAGGTVDKESAAVSDHAIEVTGESETGQLAASAVNPRTRFKRGSAPQSDTTRSTDNEHPQQDDER